MKTKPNSTSPAGPDGPMQAVTIISIHGKNESNRVYTILVPEGRTWAQTLANAFQAGTVENRPLSRLVPPVRSGDILILDDSHYLVQTGNFQKLSPQESLGIQRLTSEDTSFGYAYLVKNDLIKP
jgi:hypothetical protein